jgi:hypothetical protein
MQSRVKSMPKNRSIQISGELWEKIQKAVGDNDFTARDLIELVLSEVDLDKYAKKLASQVESDVQTAEEAAREDEREAEDEETSTDEEEAEEADDEEENFGKY